MKGKISIIMGIYNCAPYLKESIDSIINQTYSNWELIMCDDGSKDDTLKIALSYQEKYPDKIIVLKNKVNKGLNYTLNKCLKKAKGEFIARQDGDDISLPERFEKEMAFLEEHKDYALVSTSMISFDENGNFGTIRHPEKVEKDDFRFGSPFSHATIIIRKEAMEDVGGYSVADHLLRVEDYHLWFKLYAKGYKGYNIQEALYKMRDDRNARLRRNFKNRLNETRLKLWGFKTIGVSKKYYLYAFKPFILGLTPSFIYTYLHRHKLKKDSDV